MLILELRQLALGQEVILYGISKAVQDMGVLLVVKK